MKQQTTPKCDFCESEHTSCVKLINDDCPFVEEQKEINEHGDKRKGALLL